MTDRLAAHERVKYETIWSHDSYRKTSPGDREKTVAWEGLTCRAGMSLNDYGCGVARATKWFQDQGMNVLGIDHAANAAETDIPVVVACLWDMEEVPSSDFAYCCDVMEHIPTEKVDAVLQEIGRRTRVAGWFRIATRPDVMGPKLIGEPLHLTVKNDVWWGDALGKAFGVVQLIRTTPQECVFLVTN